MCICLHKYKKIQKCSYFLLLFSGGIDSSQPVQSVSQSVQLTKPGVGAPASSALISSVRTPAPGLSSQPRSSPSITQSPDSALQEGTKREWGIVTQTSALFHVWMWMLEASLLFCICLTSGLLPSSQAPLVFVTLWFCLFFTFPSCVWFPLVIYCRWLCLPYCHSHVSSFQSISLSSIKELFTILIS